MDDRRSTESKNKEPPREMPGQLPWQPRKLVERRKKQDWVVRSVTVVASLGWLLAVVALLLIDRASPAQENFITRLLSVNIVGYWDRTLLRSAFAMTLASVVVCIVGFIFNATRHRRKTDRYNKLLISICIVSVVLLVLFLVNYSRYL